MTLRPGSLIDDFYTDFNLDDHDRECLNDSFKSPTFYAVAFEVYRSPLGNLAARSKSGRAAPLARELMKGNSDECTGSRSAVVGLCCGDMFGMLDSV
jgi:hypothetical protein